MRLNLFSKLFLSILLASALVLAAMAVYINWSFRTGFTDFVNASELERVERLAAIAGEAYAWQGGWDFVRYERNAWASLLIQIGERSPVGGPGGPRGRNPERMRRMETGAIQAPLGGRIELLDMNNKPLIKARKEFIDRPNMRRQRVPVMAEDTQVGWIRVYQTRIATDALARSFVEQQLRNFYLIALFATGLSFVLAWGLVRHFLKPVRALSQGTTQLRQKAYQHRIPVMTQDELGRLALDFNALAETLGQQEGLRKQWIADISHELRTPIAVLRAEIDAMLDGIREPTLARIEELNASLKTLATLVDDLHQLSISDAGALEHPDQPVDLAAVLNDALQASEARLAGKQLQLTNRVASDTPCIIRGEHQMLSRLFTNLLENSYRYTDSKGHVEVQLHAQRDTVAVVIQDSAPGVPEESLPRLFERLYRVDKSRSRAFGGSGLGLSICQNIVSAHRGQIRAEHSPLGGLRIHITFPLNSNSEPV